MPNRDNPLSLQVLTELDYSTFKSRLDKLVKQIDADDEARAAWADNLIAVERQLMGEEKRLRKPWAHASDLAMPLTKKLLRRWIPTLYNLVALADPISYFKALERQAAKTGPDVEDFFTWLVKDYMDESLREIQYLVYDVGAKGCGYLGVAWDYRTELESRVVLASNLFPQGVPTDEQLVLRVLQSQYDIAAPDQSLLEAARKLQAGSQYVQISFRRVVADKPKIVRHDPLNVIVPPNSGASHEADYVCLVHEISPDRLLQMAKDGILNPDAVAQVVNRAAQPGEQQKKDTNTRSIDKGRADYSRRILQKEVGVTPVEEPEKLRIYQIYCSLDHNGDGIDERCIFWYSPEFKVQLALHSYPFSFRYWPVFRFDYEMVDRRPYMSRGIGQQLQDLQSQYNKQYRATSDAIDIQLSPMFKARANGLFNPRTFKLGAGAVIPISQPDDFLAVEKSPLNLHQYLQDRGELKAFAEEMVGSVDAALAATGRQLERRTAFEVQAITGQIEAVQSMDAATFQTTMAKVFQAIWELWLDLGPDEIYFQVIGKPIFKPFRKSEHNYKFQLVPAGTPGNTNRNAELSRAIQFGQLAFQVAPEWIDKVKYLEWVAKRLDPRLAQEIILSPAQNQINQVLQGAAAQVASGDAPSTMSALAAGAGGGTGAA